MDCTEIATGDEPHAIYILDNEQNAKIGSTNSVTLVIIHILFVKHIYRKNEKR